MGNDGLVDIRISGRRGCQIWGREASGDADLAREVCRLD
jgi:hypothetical protein